MTRIFKLTRIQISSGMIYRADWFFTLLTDFIQLGVYWIFWSAVYKNYTVVGNYDIIKMIEYYVVIILIKKIVVSDVGHFVSGDIYSGYFSICLVKPYLYGFMKLSQDIASKITKILQAFVSFILFLVVLVILDVHTNIGFNIYALISLLNAVILGYLTSYFIGLLGFWTTSVWAVYLMYEAIANIFGGLLFPLDIVPPNLVILFKYSPFYYMFYYPSSILSQNVSLKLIYYSLGFQYFWIILFTFLCLFTSKMGSKKFEGVGL